MTCARCGGGDWQGDPCTCVSSALPIDTIDKIITETAADMTEQISNSVQIMQDDNGYHYASINRQVLARYIQIKLAGFSNKLNQESSAK